MPKASGTIPPSVNGQTTEPAADQPHLAGPLLPGIDLTGIHLDVATALQTKEALITAKVEALATLQSLGTSSLMMNTTKVVQALANLLAAQLQVDRFNLAAEYGAMNQQIRDQVAQSRLVQVPDLSPGGRRQ